MSSTVLITGATGKQGGATITALLKSSSRSRLSIRALTRDPASPAAQQLTSQGVHMVKGDLLDHASLVSALKDIRVAFLVTDWATVGVEKEVEQGKTFIAASIEAGVEHIVFTSVQSADIADSVPHFHSKALIEDELKISGLKYTILRPVAFMDNFPLTGFARFGAMSFFNALIGSNYATQWISVGDIGRVAAQVIADSQEYEGETIDLASESLSMNQVRNSFKRATGQRPWSLWLPHSLIMAIVPEDIREMVKFWLDKNFHADIPALQKRFPGLTMEEWVAKSVKAQKA